MDECQLFCLPSRIESVIFAYVGEDVSKGGDDLVNSVRWGDRRTGGYCRGFSHMAPFVVIEALSIETDLVVSTNVTRSR